MPAPLPPPSTLQEVVLGAQLVSTLTLAGLIWFVQLVHYPLFLRIPPTAFLAYETEHANRTGYIAFPLMFAELLSALALLAPSLRLAGIPALQAWLGAALVGLLWACTVFVQIPLHNRLHRAYERPTIQRLIATNWLRTVFWTLRAALVTSWVLTLLTVRL